MKSYWSYHRIHCIDLPFFLRTGGRMDRTETKKSSGHLTCSPSSFLTLRLKTSLVLLSIVSICNSGKLFTNFSVKCVVLTFYCIPCICNCSTNIELSSLAEKDEAGFSVSVWLTMLSKIAVFLLLTSIIDLSVPSFSQFRTM